MNHLIRIDIVSAEAAIYTGKAKIVIVKGKMGELGIVYGHSPLLTELEAGPVTIRKENDEEDYIYVQSGLLEVQPHLVTILSDTAARAEDLDEAEALAAKERAEQLLVQRRTKLDYSLAQQELAHALAQLKTIQDLRKKLRV